MLEEMRSPTNDFGAPAAESDGGYTVTLVERDRDAPTLVVVEIEVVGGYAAIRRGDVAGRGVEVAVVPSLRHAERVACGTGSSGERSSCADKVGNPDAYSQRKEECGDCERGNDTPTKIRKRPTPKCKARD